MIGLVALAIRNSRPWAVTLFCVSALSLPALFSHEAFEMLALGAWAVFGHAPALLLASAWLDRARRPLLGRQRLALAGLIVVVGIDAFLIEPGWLEITHTEIRTGKVSKPHRIALVADLQTDRLGAHEHNAFSALLAARPDIVLFAGDYMQAGSTDNDMELAIETRRHLVESGFAPPMGAVAVEGDVDPGWNWEILFDGLPVQASRSRQVHRLGEIAITALDLTSSKSALATVGPQDGFHVVLGHRPDFALGTVDADLLLAGHVHGGQVRIPFLGPLITASQVPRSWAVGRTDLDDRRILYVSRGIGMERGKAPRLRFLCRPELAIIDILPE